jgi:hypothetical protein
MNFWFASWFILIRTTASDGSSLGRSNLALPLNTTPLPSVGSSTQLKTLKAIKISPTGEAYTTQILKQQLANELGLNLRDLRIIDPSLPNKIQATFTIRPNVLVLSLENIKIIIQKDEALIFTPSLPEVEDFLPSLQQNIIQNLQNRKRRRESHAFHSGSRNLSYTAPSSSLLPEPLEDVHFEHVVLESALNFVSTDLFQQVRTLAPAVQSTLNVLKTDVRGEICNQRIC